MRVLVCGGRDFDDWDLLSYTLYTIFNDGVRDLTLPFVVITGDACGADWLARAWAKYKKIDFNSISYEGYPADWKTHGKAAGSIRNQQMLDEGKPDLVVAFPGGRGTADMVKRAKRANIEVIEID